jgi:hypothetical protein
MTPTVLSLLNGLYVLERKAPPSAFIQAQTLILPTIIAIASLLLVVLPWRSWMLRLTFGDISYLTASPIDRTGLTIWRFIEVCIFVGLIGFIPFTILGAIHGSIDLIVVLPAILRGVTALAFWFTPMLAAGWVISLQEYIPHGPRPIIRFLTRAFIAVVVVVLFLNGSDVLLWPGRLVMLISQGDPTASLGWVLLLGWAALGTVAVGRVGSHISLTRAAAQGETFARLQQLGFMIFVDRQLLGSVLAETRAGQAPAVGTMPKTSGVMSIAGRQMIFYRRQYGQAITLIGIGLALGFGLLFWRIPDLILLVTSSTALILGLPTRLSQVFRQDLDVPFIAQFNVHPLTAQLVAATVVPTALMVAGALPVLIAFLPYALPYGFALLPLLWLMALFGHVEAVGRNGRPAARSIFTVILGVAALLFVQIGVFGSGTNPAAAILSGFVMTGAAALLLLMIAEIRRTGINATQAPPRPARATE